jgi:hypothetical protein
MRSSGICRGQAKADNHGLRRAIHRAGHAIGQFELRERIDTPLRVVHRPEIERELLPVDVDAARGVIGLASPAEVIT